MDMVNKPNHYIKVVNGVECECIDTIEIMTSDLCGMDSVCVGNAVKYLWRFKGKNGVEDLKKARKYLDMLIKEYEE